MGFIGGLLGLNGGMGGTGFNAINPTNMGQINNAYSGAQNAQQQQQQLLQALQNQHGLNHQNQIYSQLQNVAAGNGPNPAQAMLNQATGQNVANQAALAAGQRGAGANIGLLERNAANAGANAQQQAAGQAATLQANQSLNALGQAGGLANQMAANQMAGTLANTQAAQSEQQLLNNANSQYNTIQGGLAQQGMQGQQGLLGGLLGGAGALLGLADGGEVDQHMAQGGALTQFLNGWAGNAAAPMAEMQSLNPGAQSIGKGMMQFEQGLGKMLHPNQAQAINNAGMTNAMALPTDNINPLQQMAAEGGNVGSKLKKGGHVPGKPKFKGNDYRNDTVSAKLSPGEVVIPNSVMQSQDPVNNAAKFVQAVLAKKGMKRG